MFVSDGGEKHETGMRKGDLVIADDPESESSVLSRFYGIVRDVSNKGSVSIELADGSVIKRQRNSIAVYIHPPSNWQDLFERQEVIFNNQRQSLSSFQPKSHPSS